MTKQKSCATILLPGRILFALHWQTALAKRLKGVPRLTFAVIPYLSHLTQVTCILNYFILPPRTCQQVNAAHELHMLTLSKIFRNRRRDKWKRTRARIMKRYHTIANRPQNPKRARKRSRCCRILLFFENVRFDTFWMKNENLRLAWATWRVAHIKSYQEKEKFVENTLSIHPLTKLRSP